MYSKQRKAFCLCVEALISLGSNVRMPALQQICLAQGGEYEDKDEDVGVSEHESEHD